jgi:hypothetical protein
MISEAALRDLPGFANDDVKARLHKALADWRANTPAAVN